MSEKVEGDISATAETGDSDVEGLATPIPIGNLNIVENQEGNDALNLDIKSEEINKIEFKSSQVIPGNTYQELNDTNTETEVVTTESPETETCSDGETMGGSEEMLNKPCQPCIENNKHIDSVLYCIECEDYLCEKCVEMHRGVKLSKSHKLVPKEIPDKNGNELTIYKKEECPIHLNEFIEWFCISDDKLCCSICKATEHSKCQSLVAITSAAKTTERQTIEQAITETQTILKSAIDKKRTDIKLLDEDKNDSLRVLEDIKTDTEKTFQSLRCSLDKENRKIEAKYVEQSTYLNTDIDNYSKIVNNLDTTVALLKKENMCEEYKFIQMKKAEQHLKSISMTISDIEPEPVSTPIGFERDKLYDHKLNAFNRFGYFDEEKSLYKCSKPKRISILKGNDKETIVFDICAVGYDDILITDWTNCSIKLIDTNSCTIKSRLKLPGNPFAICKLEEAETYAVTLTHLKQVMFIKLLCEREVMRAVKEAFETGEKCQGIVCCNSRLLVVCGGTITTDVGPGHIRIFDMTGKLQETVIADTLGRAIFSAPCKIQHVPETQTALISDTGCLIEIDASSNAISKVHTILPICSFQASVCFDPDHRVLIAEPSSKCIKLLSKDYLRVETVVTNLPQQPLAIAMDTSRLKLYVGFEKSKDLYCFQIEKNNWDKAPTFR